MASKKKATAKKPVPERALADEIRELEDGQARRALERARTWAHLIDQLDELIDRADDLFTHGIPVDPDEAREEFERQKRERPPEGRNESLHETRAELAWEKSCLLARDLLLAENRSAIVGVDGAAFADVRARLEGKPAVDPIATSAQSLACAIHGARTLLEADLALAKRSRSTRPPVGVEIRVLRVLLGSPIALAGDAIASKIGTRRESVAAKTVWDAVLRLRAECGFELEKSGAGYVASDRDHRLAREYGISGEVVEAETE